MKTVVRQAGRQAGRQAIRTALYCILLTGQVLVATQLMKETNAHTALRQYRCGEISGTYTEQQGRALVIYLQGEPRKCPRLNHHHRIWPL